ncbi:MAG: hypothetical protein LIO92_13050 [Clostridiales bacterium]|nr:hypothetical protein [Clostridiales bacterium]
MTKLQIISRLWSHVYDLKMVVCGQTEKSMEEIEREIDITECECRRYADADDEELYALDILRAAKAMNEGRM